ncbi:hypothetical protein MNBD_IGNAVI01-640 [hydrothermal vent metagenome]|uniref:MmcQ-like protein n=1 Tax=hydrothermal vent metagenome TaxID=652676 RepID=A0A3B1D3E1_9ZZZZ
MDIEKIREYCLNKPGTSESLPFDETTLVFKVMSKMYCLLNMEPPFSINLKCLPEKAIELREQFEDVQPGYHMNKKHWNTILLDGNLKDSQVIEWINDSYNLVAAGLTKKEKTELTELLNK